MPNEKARVMFNISKDEFIAAAEKDAKSSLVRLYERPSPECTLIFTEPKPAHGKVKERLFKLHNLTNSRGEANEGKLSGRASMGPDDDDNSLSVGRAAVVSESDVYLEQLITEVKKPFMYDAAVDVDISKLSM